MFVKFFKQKSIARRLILATLISSSVITTLFTSFAFYLDYTNEMDALEAAFTQVKNGYLESVAIAAWNLDEEQLEQQMQGILNFPDVTSVTLDTGSENFDRTLKKSGEHVNKYNEDREFPLVISDINREVGTLSVSITQYYIYQRLIKKGALFFVTQGIKTFIVSFIMFLIFQNIISRHIFAIVTQIKAKEVKDFSNENNRIYLNRDKHYEDELTYLVARLNEVFRLAALNLEEKDNVIEQQNKSVMQSTKMAAVGEMAGGIAHEINNPLAIIIGNTDRGLRAIDKDEINREQIQKILNKIRDMGYRISSVVKGLLYFSHESMEEPLAYARVSKIIDMAVDLCTEKYKSSGVKLDVKNIEDIEISCREVQISQVILNILNNAYDAVMEDKDPNERWVKVTAKNEGKFVQIQISNGGTVIPNEVAERIFDPFYTTKPVGKGTGLGLSISKGILEAHSGSLAVENAGGVTCFTICLPTLESERKRA